MGCGCDEKLLTRGVSYYICDEQKGIFIHIPRTAGTSICKTLGNVAPRMILPHATARFVQSIIGDVFWRKMFTFAFVRNPWERHVSWYLYHQRHFGVTFSFDNYILDNMTLVENYASIDWITGGYWSQELFVERNGEQIVNFIGQYENLKDDFNYICTVLGIETELQFSNNTPDKYDYRTFYTDKTAEILGKRCSWEIKRFGYKF